MSAAPYRAVVVGCGRIGSAFTDEARTPGVHSHAQAYREQPRMVLAGLADTHGGRLSAATSRWGTPGDRDGIALCHRIRPDVVSVCTPDDTHPDIIRALLDVAAPRVIFAEKPIARSASEAESLADLARSRQCVLMVNHTRRFSGAFRALASEMRAGLHGLPLRARVTYGKGLRHNGVHAVDLLRLWLGEPTAVLGRPTPWQWNGDRTYDATLELEDSARAYVEGFDERVATVFEGEVLTERTRWRFWNGGDDWEFGEVGESPTYAGYRAYLPTGRERSDERFNRPLGRCLAEAVANIVDVLDGRATPLSGVEDAVATMRVIERIESSARLPA